MAEKRLLHATVANAARRVDGTLPPRPEPPRKNPAPGDHTR
jgi:hypothetical protein